jgi:ankyrin repeat protein
MTPLEKQLLDSNFLRSVQADRWEEVQPGLAKGASINAIDKEGNNALTLAAPRGGAAMALQLISSGINKDHQNHNGRSALIEAVMSKNTPMVDALLFKGVNPNLKDGGDWGAIHYLSVTATVDDLIMMNSLLKSGVDINLPCLNQESPLMMATTAVNADAVSSLLKASADVNLQDKNGRTALMCATTHGLWNEQTDYIMEMLLEAGADLRAQDNKGWTAYDHAVSRGLKGAEKRLRDTALERASAFGKGISQPIKVPKVLRFKP